MIAELEKEVMRKMSRYSLTTMLCPPFTSMQQHNFLLKIFPYITTGMALPSLGPNHARGGEQGEETITHLLKIKSSAGPG